MLSRKTARQNHSALCQGIHTPVPGNSRQTAGKRTGTGAKKGFSGIFLKTLIYIIFHTNETVPQPLLSHTRIFFLKQ